ncbi:hypothetical protein [Sinomonas sp. P10A9]|uniref:Uncharacterized protein n=1 Tax=Sinomonas puerhi TaxID=3238584 RepID=A0AB39L6F1_9MICC
MEAKPPAPAPANRFTIPWQGAAAGVAAGVAAGLAFFLLCLATVLLAAAGGAVESVGKSVPAVGDAVASEAAGAVAAIAAQLGAMALLGSAEGHASAAFGVQGSASIFAVPAGLTLVAALLALAAGALQARFSPATSVAERAAQAGALGLGFAVTTTVIAASAPVRSASSGAAVDLSAAGFVPFLVALMLGAGMAWLGSGMGREQVPKPAVGTQVARLAAMVLPGAKACAVHLLAFSVIAVPAAWIAGGIQGGWGATLSALLWLGHAAAGAFTIGHLGGIAGGSAFGAVRNEGLYYFLAGDSGPVPVWAAWLLVVLAILVTMVAGTVLALARGASSQDWRPAWVGPVVYGLAGLGILGLFHVSMSATFSAFLGAGSVQASAGPAGWFPLVLAGWGLLAEAASRVMAPSLLAALPGPVLAALGRAVGPTAVPAHDAAPSPSAPPAPAALPAVGTLSPRARKRALVALAVVVGVGLLVGAGAVALAVVKAGRGPDAVVRAYLDDVVAGRAQGAMGKVSPNVPNESRALLSDDVYGKAGGRIDRYSVVSTESKGTSSSVVVELSQGGRTERTTFMVSKRDPNVFDDNWAVDSGSLVRPVKVTVNTKNPKMTANGSAVTAAGPDVNVGSSYSLGSASAQTGPDGWLSDRTTTLTFYALPGQYAFGVDTGSPLLDGAEQRVTVAIGAQAPASATLKAAPSKEFRDQLDASVKAFLDRCAARTALSVSTGFSDAECPFDRSGWSGYDYRNVHWSITKAPTYAVGDRVYSDGAVAVEPKTTGTAELSYQSKSTSSYAKDSPYTDTKDTLSISLYGVAKVKDGKAEFQFVPYGIYKPGP